MGQEGQGSRKQENTAEINHGQVRQRDTGDLHEVDVKEKREANQNKTGNTRPDTMT